MFKASLRTVCFAVTALLVSHSAGRAQSFSCQVADPVGDFFPASPCNGFTTAPYLDMVSSSASRNGGQFRFEMTLAGEVPAAPPLDPGAKQLVWAWNLNTDPNTSPMGFPFDPATVAPPEFVVRVVWNGTSFSGVVIDRRPLLAGAEAVVVPVPFERSGSVLATVVSASLLGDPTSLQWISATQLYMAHDGTSGFCIMDRTANSPCGP